MIACIIFVFGAMLEYSAILLLLKLERMNHGPYAKVGQARGNSILSYNL